MEEVLRHENLVKAYRKLRLQAPLSGDDTKEMLISSGEFALVVTLPRHTHPGDDYTVVLQG